MHWNKRQFFSNPTSVYTVNMILPVKYNTFFHKRNLELSTLSSLTKKKSYFPIQMKSFYAQVTSIIQTGDCEPQKKKKFNIMGLNFENPAHI
jgi:hypothetical protein